MCCRRNLATTFNLSLHGLKEIVLRLLLLPIIFGVLYGVYFQMEDYQRVFVTRNGLVFNIMAAAYFTSIIATVLTCLYPFPWYDMRPLEKTGKFSYFSQQTQNEILPRIARRTLRRSIVLRRLHHIFAALLISLYSGFSEDHTSVSKIVMRLTECIERTLASVPGCRITRKKTTGCD